MQRQLACVFVADTLDIGIRRRFFPPHQQPVDRVDIGLGAGQDRISIGRLTRRNAPRLFQPYTDGGLRIGAFGYGIDLIQLQAGADREKGFDRFEGGIDRAVTLGGGFLLDPINL